MNGLRTLRTGTLFILAAIGLTAACTAGDKPASAPAVTAAAQSAAPTVAAAVVAAPSAAASVSTEAPQWKPQAYNVASLTSVVGAIPKVKETDPVVIVAEGEFFKIEDKKGWVVVHQDDSYASHSYGGMWVHNGGLLGAPAASEGSVAVQAIDVPVAGAYRVWSKYQAPPYFNYHHKIEVVQGGKSVYSHTYGDVNAERFYSFAAAYKSKPIKQLWWFWGVDHDAAEAPKTTAQLAAGRAEIRITSLKNTAPAGDRFIDFVVVTNEQQDTYRGYIPPNMSSPFMIEAIAGNKVYVRFKNPLAVPTKLTARTAGHLQPDYGGRAVTFPDADVAPGQWSPWFNIAPALRLAHDDGAWFTLTAAAKGESPQIEYEAARDPQGSDKVGSGKVINGEVVVFPIDIVWNKASKVMTSREHAELITNKATKEWRRANGGKKPQQLAYYGSFRPDADWVNKFKDSLGYNTQLPAGFQKLERDGYHQHTHSLAEINNFTAKLTPEQKKNFRILSFGDEIHLGQVNYGDPAMSEKFRGWLKEKGYTKEDLGVDVSAATLSKAADAPRLAYYSKLFSAEQMFGRFADMTKAAETQLNKDVLTGANYSPHGAPQYWGHLDQWIDIFKFRGMSAYWTEDYIFSVPESPQMIGWMLANARCAVKYHSLPIHFYVMPHAPGQLAEYLRRGMVYSIGAGATQIDSFWVGPAENYTENFVAWYYPDSFRAISESIYDSGEIEHIAVGGKYRPSRVGLVLSRAVDFNEERVKITPQDDPFAQLCPMDMGGYQQTLCRKDVHGLYLSLRHAQQGVDLITEEDISDPKVDALKNYDVIYYAGEWADTHAVKKLDAWVKNGGVLYACAGLGYMNQYGQPEQSMLNLLGLKSVTTEKNARHIRPMLELPLLKPIDTIKMDGLEIPAVAMKQVLTPADAKVVGTWSDGKSAAVTVRDYGKGKAIAVGALSGHNYLKAGAKVTPWARGGRRMVYVQAAPGTAAHKLVTLGVDAKPVAVPVRTSDPLVEAMLIDNAKGTLVTLVNWNPSPVKDVTVEVAVPFKPSAARSVQGQKSVPVTYADGKATFTINLTEADYVSLSK